MYSPTLFAYSRAGADPAEDVVQAAGTSVVLFDHEVEYTDQSMLVVRIRRMYFSMHGTSKVHAGIMICTRLVGLAVVAQALIFATALMRLISRRYNEIDAGMRFTLYIMKPIHFGVERSILS